MPTFQVFWSDLTREKAGLAYKLWGRCFNH